VSASRPTPDSYWVEPGRLLAGPYPRELAPFREAGVTAFLDLTEEGEYGLAPYSPLLGDGIRAMRFPVPDGSHPGRDEMAGILETIDELLASDEVVYVHCYGGIGRTGTVVGCYLVRHGVSGDEALVRIARLRGQPIEWPEQRQFVRDWGG
jgi:hypothetical protein